MYADITEGTWDSEAESAAALDEALDAVGLWNVYREVRGTLSHPKPGQVEKAIRIDRLLVPRQDLVELGWTHGIVGIEIKRSGVKIGPPIAQAMDYSRGVWTLPPSNIKVWLDWVFVWPMPKQMGTTASILAQNRIGSASSDSYTTLHLKSGEQNLIRISHFRGRRTIDIGVAANGRKVGSR